MTKIIIMDRRGAWPTGVEREYPCITLRANNWNDYGYETLFSHATIWLSAEEGIVLGSVKIGRYGYSFNDAAMRVVLSPVSGPLAPEYFSLGQTQEYYRKLAALPAEIVDMYIGAVRDIPGLGLPQAGLEAEEVFRVSLLRESSAREAMDFAPSLFGRAARTVSAFTFTTQLKGAAGPHRIDFDFTVDGGLPHRVNVLVGLNGAGKTQLMARLAVLLSRYQEAEKVNALRQDGLSFETVGRLEPMPSIYGVIAVSFSAFDDFELPGAGEADGGDRGEDDGAEAGPDFRYAYCGLRNPDGSISNERRLADRIPGVVAMMSNHHRALLIEALPSIFPVNKPTLDEVILPAFFQRLSAGQRIVLNIICDLIVHIRKRSLVLLDEPETHLHPQLLSTLLSLVNDLLEANDSFAVVATHSPIVVQQVLARRVQKVRRLEGDLPVVDRPDIETFGEGLTEIVRSVFDTMPGDRDYEEVIDRLLEQHEGSAAKVLELFGGRLGLNARIYLGSRESLN